MIFLQPYFLFGLLALSIPVIIHLFQFRRYKTVYFTNVSFIRNLKKETEKQSRLKHLLMLLARLLAITALVLAFARPVIPEGDNAGEDIKARNYVSIYIDNSRSMQLQSGKGPMLNEARAKALNIASTYSNEVDFQLITNDFKAYHQRFVDKSKIKSLVEEVDISPTTRSISEVVQRQKQLFDNTKGRINKHIYLISDFQKTTADIEKIDADSSYRISLVKVNAAQPNNLYIDSCWFREPVRQLRQTSVLNVRVSNSGEKDYEKIPLKLKIDGKQRALASFSIKAGGTVETELSFTNRSTGWHKGIVELVDNPVTFDDKFYFTYEIKPAIDVLEIFDGSPSPYLSRLYGKDSLIRFTSSNVLKLNYSELDQYQLIILNELASFSSGLERKLKKLVNEGESDLLIIPHGEAAGANSRITDALGLGQYIRIDSNKTEVGEIATAHPLYENVFMQKVDLTSDENFDLPAVQKYWMISEQPDADVLMRLISNQPLLVQEKRGAVHLYQLASPLRDEYTNLARHALFVPTFHRMAITSQKSLPLYHYLGEDRPIELPAVFTRDGDKVIKLRHLGSEYELIPRPALTTGNMHIRNDVKQPGHYRMMYADSVRGMLSFNYNRSESDMQMLTEEQLAKSSSDNIKSVLNVYADSDKPLKRQIRTNQAGYPLWRWFVVMVLIFIGIEILILRFVK